MTYDQFVVEAFGLNVLPITNHDYPNPGTALATAFQGNNLFWVGASGVSGGGGVRPKLYAPASWNQGSSYSHLDDATYPAGNPNSLMTPAIGQAEVILNPDPITLGMFTDMGWGGGGGAPPSTPSVTSINPTSGPQGGGTVVTITGTNFSTTPGATTVAFGANAGTSVNCASAMSCTTTSPAGSGTVDVRSRLAGRSAPTSPPITSPIPAVVVAARR